ncbi:hypothetical protein M8494_36970, partial [Serratia ureilytica]
NGRNFSTEPIVRKSRFLLVTLLCLCAAAVLYVMAYRALGHYLSDGEQACRISTLKSAEAVRRRADCADSAVRRRGSIPAPSRAAVWSRLFVVR